MLKIYILIHIILCIIALKETVMRTTINIDDTLIERASKLTGIKEKTSLVKRGLESLIALESSKKLARLGGSEKKLNPVPRRRTASE